ncbi:MAG: hypothetical protein ACI83H_000511 [Glaciecola sp.]|jgi:hypothetical protein
MKNLLLYLFIFSLVSSCSKDKPGLENMPPDLWYGEFSEITYYSAILTWNGEDPNGDDIIWEIKFDGTQVYYGELNYNTGNFFDSAYFYEFENLEPATEYSVDLIAMDGKGGETKKAFEFTTPYGPPKVEILDVTEITLFSVHFDAKIIDSGASTITETGFLVHTLNNPVIEGSGLNFTDWANANGEFSIDLTGLDNIYPYPYYVRAYAINEEGVGYSEAKSFIIPNDITYNGDVVLNSQDELMTFLQLIVK